MHIPPRECAFTLSNLAREFAILIFVDKTMTNQLPLPPREVNYDEARVPPYTLPDPLVFADGRPVKDAKDWAARRREILDIFAHEMYGVEPPPPEALQVELVEEGTTLAGLAIRRQYRLRFRADGSGPCLDWRRRILLRRRDRFQPASGALQPGDRRHGDELWGLLTGAYQQY